MIRFASIILLAILILSFGQYNFSDSDSIIFLIGNYEISTNKKFLFFVAAISLIIISFIIYLIISVIFFAKHRKIMNKNHKYHDSLDNMVDAITFTSLGDYKSSQKALKKLNKNIPNHPLVNLLYLQSHNLTNNQKEMAKYFKALLNDQQTRVFALQGLAILSKKNNDLEQAKLYLEESYHLAPNASHTINALIELYKKSNNSKALIDIINQNSKKKNIEKKNYEHELGLSYLDLSLNSDDKKSKEKYLRKAQKFYPSNHQIQIEFAKFLLNEGKKYRLTKYIKAIATENHHPELIEIYCDNFSNKNTNYLFKQLANLIEKTPNNEAAVIKYCQLCKAHKKNYKQTKSYLKRSLATSNNPLIYQAALEFFENYQANVIDEEFYEELLKQEDNYQKSYSFQCNICNHTTDSWHATCPNCHNYDSIIWQ